MAYQRYEELGITIPGTFLGWGANPAAYMAEEKDIDIAWFGHAYGERQGRVESLIFPLKDRYWLNVRIHGRNQPDGPVGMLEMFDKNERIDLITLSESLLKSGNLEIIGGPPYLMDLMEVNRW